MASTAADILDDVVETLRSTEAFSTVCLGVSASETEVPRAEVIYEGIEVINPDDSSGTTWCRLRASVNIHSRATDSASGTRRADELAEAAAEALLIDPHRGSRCVNLPAGMATEVQRVRPIGGLKRPEVAVSIEFRCHFEKDQS
jgi:hypothetical protein